jgi:hypothetical protein
VWELFHVHAPRFRYRAWAVDRCVACRKQRWRDATPEEILRHAS